MGSVISHYFAFKGASEALLGVIERYLRYLGALGILAATLQWLGYLGHLCRPALGNVGTETVGMLACLHLVAGQISTRDDRGGSCEGYASSWGWRPGYPVIWGGLLCGVACMYMS